MLNFFHTNYLSSFHIFLTTESNYLFDINRRAILTGMVYSVWSRYLSVYEIKTSNGQGAVKAR